MFETDQHCDSNFANVSNIPFLEFVDYEYLALVVRQWMNEDLAPS